MRKNIGMSQNSLLPNVFRGRRSGVFIANFEHISHLVLVFLLLILNMQMQDG